MVNFSVFNELSLPLKDLNDFEEFFKILSILKSYGFNKMRTDVPFTHYPEILANKNFQQLLGQIRDRDQQRRLKNFIANVLITIESPLILDDEIEYHEEAVVSEYYYNDEPNFGGLACCDIWDTISVSFNSSDQWDKNSISLQKNSVDIGIRHCSKVEHLDTHVKFFEEFKTYNKLDITQKNFWERKLELFPNRVIFSKEIKDQIQRLDKIIFTKAMDILIDIDKNKKNPTDYNYSGESRSVKDDTNLKKYRYFTIDDKKVFFENHIKSLPNANRIYFLEYDDKIYIGYIGKHLPTKKFD